VIAPEQDRLTQLLDELASRADGTAPADRLERVHRRARRTTQLRVVAAATVAAVVVVGAGALLTRTEDVGRQQQPGGPSVTPTTTAPLPSSVSTPTTSQSPTQRPTPHPSRTLVPASSRYPAAGSCAFTTGTVVTVTLNPDVPMPRCVSLHRWQELRVVNNSTLLGSPALTLTVRWADYPARTLKPGESTTYKDLAGSYLAVGVHRIVAAPLYGGQPEAEVWLH
jgi:hypothetical protein